VSFVCVCVCVCECESIQAVPRLILSRILWLPICFLKNIKFKIYRTLILPDLYGCETWSVPTEGITWSECVQK